MEKGQEVGFPQRNRLFSFDGQTSRQGLRLVDTFHMDAMHITDWKGLKKQVVSNKKILNWTIFAGVIAMTLSVSLFLITQLSKSG